MNPAIEMIIDRLKSHPDDFFGPVDNSALHTYESPRLRNLERMMDREFTPRRDNGDEVRIADDTVAFWFLTPEERESLRLAFTQAKRERFTAETVFNMMRPNDEREEQALRYQTQGRQYGKSTVNEVMRMNSLGSLGIGTQAPSNWKPNI